ncbi:MAG: hypothetical protein ABI655_01800 [Phenylobacterium sp.]
MSPKVAAVALLASGAPLGLQACATPEPVAFGPIGEGARFGYSDRANPDGGHIVLVVMPSWSPPSDVRAYWDRRADELCPQGVSKRIVFRSERKENMLHASYVQYGASFSSRLTTAYELEGYVYCKAVIPVG